MSLKRLTMALVSCILAATATAEEPVGQRPYEMVWAGRTEDTHPALVDFENLDGWTVEAEDAEASFTRSRQQQLWGQYVGRLVYRGTGPRATVTVRPPKPIDVPGPLDCLNFWVYGNNWAWQPDASTPQVSIAVLLRGRDGRTAAIHLGNVRWREWWVMHHRLSPAEIDIVKQGAVLEGIRITGCRNTEDRELYFDNLSLYQEQLAPLAFEPRRQRGVDPFPGQSPGTNTGPGRLPFPTREETILPDNLVADFQVQLIDKTAKPDSTAFEFDYRASDGHLVYRYQPATGTLGDVTACWEGRGEPFQPLAEGGVYFAAEGKPPALPEKAELVSCRQDGTTVVAVWRCTFGERTAEVTYTFRLWQKSLVVDVRCLGGDVAEVRFGRAKGVQEPRLVTLPYLPCDEQRPAVLVTGPVEKPLFLMGLVDYYRTNASSLWADNRTADEGAVYNGGTRYAPRTDGRRNDCFERLFVTVSPRFEEVLPNVANPKSPWMHVAGERLWRAHGASNRESDYALWRQVARYGMTKVVITDHETGWRDGGESFTLRTRAAPGKGGDEGQADYARKIRALGFRYGIYNNYTDFAPVNEHWSEDYVTRLSNGEWQPAWARCYNLKPSRAVELEARLAPIVQQKFHLDTAYCDVHTAVRPWSYCDFDARVPGAGTLAATFYSYGEIMLDQKATWNGPVYSEGNNHWYYCGLTDGNYGQDQLARLDERPWLVDFDLRKLHPLCCNFGMGNLGMFYGRGEGLGRTPEERDAKLDRFLAATLAFGHTGFFVLEGGMANGVRSYFTLQQIHARYAQETAESIRYHDGQGNLLDTSAAVASGAFERSQIETRYSHGLRVVVNGHPTETWKTADALLPPNGWFARDDRDGKLIAWSALVDGHRADYVDSPAYLYADGRGRLTRFEKAACDGQLIAHKRPDGTMELIPVERCTVFGVSLDGRAATAEALDADTKSLGPAETRLSRGLVYVTPVPQAFSYVLTPGAKPEVSLRCDRQQVVPGEMVTVVGQTEHAVRIPADAAPGTHLWQQTEGQWIDFLVFPLVEARLTVDGAYRLELLGHLPAAADAQVSLAGQTQTVRLTPGEMARVEFPWQEPQGEEVREVRLKVTVGDLAYERSWWVKTEAAIITLAELGPDFRSGERLRDGKETPVQQTSGAIAAWRDATCGEEARHCLFMHPPYKTGVGYTFALFEPVELPGKGLSQNLPSPLAGEGSGVRGSIAIGSNAKAAFRCRIGKENGSDPGDGILFRVAVVSEDGTETVVAERQWIEHAWTPPSADLAPWAGKRVQIKLVADVGPANNSSGDWACWADLRLETAEPTLATTVHDQM